MSVASALVRTEGVAIITIPNRRREADFHNFLASGLGGESFARQRIYLKSQAVQGCNKIGYSGAEAVVLHYLLGKNLATTSLDLARLNLRNPR